MNTPLAILIHGQKHNGKTTLSKHITRALNSPLTRCEVFSFATPLKWELANSYGHRAYTPKQIFDELNDPEKKENYRDRITKLADETKEKNGQDYYAKLLIKTLEDSDERNGKLFVPVIDDLRYGYEKTAVVGAGFNTYSIKIVRPGVKNVVTHSSEEGMSDKDFNYFVLNEFSGPEDPLWEYEVDRLIKHWRYTCLR